MNLHIVQLDKEIDRVSNEFENVYFVFQLNFLFLNNEKLILKFLQSNFVFLLVVEFFRELEWTFEQDGTID